MVIKIKKIILVVVTILIIIAIGIFSLINVLFYSMTRLPVGDYLSESTSSNGTYAIKTYLCNGGATVDYAVRGTSKPISLEDKIWIYFSKCVFIF